MRGLFRLLIVEFETLSYENVIKAEMRLWIVLLIGANIGTPPPPPSIFVFVVSPVLLQGRARGEQVVLVLGSLSATQPVGMAGLGGF